MRAFGMGKRCEKSIPQSRAAFNCILEWGLNLRTKKKRTIVPLTLSCSIRRMRYSLTTAVCVWWGCRYVVSDEYAIKMSRTSRKSGQHLVTHSQVPQLVPWTLVSAGQCLSSSDYAKPCVRLASISSWTHWLNTPPAWEEGQVLPPPPPGFYR